MSKRATVARGLSVWIGKSGPVLFESATEVVVEVEARDDAGHGVYRVRMPIGNVDFEEEAGPSA